jgi:hypothetical protein
VAACAADQGLELAQAVDMPVDNLSLIFNRAGD